MNENDYGCDCSGCSCPLDASPSEEPSSSPTSTPVPSTMTPTESPTTSPIPTAEVVGVVSFTELVAAVASGDPLVNIGATSITFDDPVQVSNGATVEIAGAASAVALDGGNAVRLFRVNGDLTLRALSLVNGAVSTSSCSGAMLACVGGAIYVGATGSLVLDDCVVEHNKAYVRSFVLYLFSLHWLIGLTFSFVLLGLGYCTERWRSILVRWRFGCVRRFDVHEQHRCSHGVCLK